MSCKLWSKVTSVFLNINFWAKIIEVLWEMLTFWNYCALLLKTCLFSENFDSLCECLYTLRNCPNMIKTSIFLRKCLFVHVLISFVGKLLFWFKIWFYSVIFWKKCHFPSKIYISGGINFLEKSSNFLRKGVNLAVNFVRNNNWY